MIEHERSVPLRAMYVISAACLIATSTLLIGPGLAYAQEKAVEVDISSWWNCSCT